MLNNHTLETPRFKVHPEGRPAAKKLLQAIEYSWQGDEEDGFANEKTMLKQLDKYLKDEKGGKELGLSPEEIMKEMLSAQKLAEQCFDDLGLQEKVDDKDESLILPYHGKGHVRNTIFSGMKILLPKLERISKKYNFSSEEKKYWIASATRILALHEIDDWWVPALPVGDSKIQKVKDMIRADLVKGGISVVDFDDYIQLDDFVKSVDERINDISSSKGKRFLATDDEVEAHGKQRKIFTNVEMVQALGNTVAGADFMQTLNPNYKQLRKLRYEGKELMVMIGPLCLAVEMALIKPHYLPPSWVDTMPDGSRRLAYDKIGVDTNFLDKIWEKTSMNWLDLGKFDQLEMRNAMDAFKDMIQYVMKKKGINSILT